jgi:hypothetical protein
MAQEVITHPAENADPAAGPSGERPYEMAGRTEERVPLVAFDDVSGWLVEGQEAEGWLRRSAEQRLYRDTCGKLVYVGQGANPSILVRPQEPITIPEPWDAVNFWNYGNTWGWAPDPTTPPLQASVVLRDAGGWQFELPLGGMDYQYWFLANSRLHAAELARLQRPVQLLGIRFTNARNVEPRTVYLGPLTFFKEELKPLQFEPWPEKLPFPTRAETILPRNRAQGFRNRVQQDGKATVFSYRGRDTDLEYRYVASDGTLGDLEVRCGKTVLRPYVGGGVQLAARGGLAAPTDPEVQRTLTGTELKDEVLTVRWHLQIADVGADVEYRFRIVQKSLLIDIAVAQPVAERVALGRAEGVTDGKLFRIPYLTYGGNDPRVLCSAGLFVFTQFDWYVSDASELVGGAAQGPDWAVYNGGALYIPKTDGARNLVRERLFLNASPDFQEVLPTIPNPPSPMRLAQGDRLWRVKSGADHRAEIDEATRYRQYGCEKVSIRYHEDSWRDAGESFTFRLEAAPQRGGDAALRQFVAAVQALGWRVGLYTNYTDFAPVNSYWNEDWVSRAPNGDWVRAWMRCYAPKPMRAVEMEAKLAPQIQAKFGEDHSYCDVHTAVSPFSRVDYDARVPGAGTFRRTFECFGRLLYNEKLAHQGPVYSEGNNHWWYSGLTDGNYAQIISPSPPREPLLVDFDLLQMHPLQMDAGMGSPGMFFRGAPANLDQFLATTLAYGHLGFLGEWAMPGDLKCYYMMQRIQKHYAMVPVRRIEYEANGALVDTSTALQAPDWPTNRLHVVYENGTEVWVNGAAEPWAIAIRSRQDGVRRTRAELPPWGYLAWRDDAADPVFVSSAIEPLAGDQRLGGPRQRLDVARSPGQVYLDSRGGYAVCDPVAVEGSGAFKLENGVPWVIPTDHFADFALTPRLAGLDPDRDIRVEAVAADGTLVEPPTTRWSGPFFHLLPGAGKACTYRLLQADRPRPRELHSERLALLGRNLEVQGLTAAHLQGEAYWEVRGERVPARPAESSKGKGLAFLVPASAQARDHLWLALPVAGETLWLDAIAAAACELALDLPRQATLGRDQALSAKLLLTSNLAVAASLPLRLQITPAGTCRPDVLEQGLLPQRPTAIPIELQLPWQAGTYAVTVTSGYATATAKLTAELGQRALADLLDPQLPFVKGHRARGGEEAFGGDNAYAGEVQRGGGCAGGVQRPSLLMHPPYGPLKAGYVFATFAVDLPAGSPASLRFAMAMADGGDLSDGVVFKVDVLDGSGRATEVFAQHHSERAWLPARADLAAFAGQKVTLKLTVDCGPADNTTNDHALWGEPKVVLAEEQLQVRRE